MLKWAKIDYDEGPGKEGNVGPYIQVCKNFIPIIHINMNLVNENKLIPSLCGKIN